MQCVSDGSKFPACLKTIEEGHSISSNIICLNKNNCSMKTWKLSYDLIVFTSKYLYRKGECMLDLRASWIQARCQILRGSECIFFLQRMDKLVKEKTPNWKLLSTDCKASSLDKACLPNLGHGSICLGVLESEREREVGWWQLLVLGSWGVAPGGGGHEGAWRPGPSKGFG